MRGLLFHIAADTKNPGIVGPVFPEETFEFLPIKSEVSAGTYRYKDFPAKNTKYGKSLGDFLPSDIAEFYVHYDPDFNNFTYGQPVEEIPRFWVLKKLKEADMIFFIASLAPYDAEVYKEKDIVLRNFQRGKKNKYVIGFFTIKGVALAKASKSQLEITSLSGNVTGDIVKTSHHYKRFEYNNPDHFILIVGNSQRSAPLNRAVKLTEGFRDTSFELNELGRSILRNNSHRLRIAWIHDNAVKTLASSIVGTNPQLSDKLQHILQTT
jgi:hypothetical protein